MGRRAEALDGLLEAERLFAALHAEDPAVTRQYAPCLDDLWQVYVDSAPPSCVPNSATCWS